MSVLPLIIRYSDDPLGAAFGCNLHEEQFKGSRNRQPPRWKSCFLPTDQRKHWSMPHRRHCGRDPQSVTVNKDGFQVFMDVKHFVPDEITVKTVDNSVVVEAKHGEREDKHGHVFRHFIRRYEIPKQFDTVDVISTLSTDGVLTIKASPPKPKSGEYDVRVIPIVQTGPVKKNSSGHKNEES